MLRVRAIANAVCTTAPMRASHTAAAAHCARSDVKEKPLRLKVSDPALLLNNIAMRYDSASRVIMEYIDNPLDSAEKGFRQHNSDNAYPQPLRVTVTVDSKLRSVEIVDNAQGMTAAELTRVVSNVGESTKRGQPWLNGQFGFGIHAFRAAATTMTVVTKHADDKLYKLSVNRQQSEFKALEPLSENPQTLLRGAQTGTQVLLQDFDPSWFRGVSAKGIAREIERHFETLLLRKQLQISVVEAGRSPVEHVCAPFNYAGTPGTFVTRTVPVTVGGQHLGDMNVNILISENPSPHRKVRFFQHGRQINFVGDVKSFMDVSLHKGRLWSHPQLLGFIDVDKVLSPVITRDEFKRTPARDACYKALAAIEPELSQALERASAQQRESSMASLETILRGVLSQVANADKKAAAAQNLDAAQEEPQLPPPPLSVAVDNVAYDVVEGDRDALEKALIDDDLAPADAAADAVPDEPAAAPKHKVPRLSGPFDIRFVHAKAEPGAQPQRSLVVGDCIFINVDHANFVERVDVDAHERPRMTERLASYLASVVAVHYRASSTAGADPRPAAVLTTDVRHDLFVGLLDSTTQMETALRKKLPALNRSFKAQLLD